MAVADQVPKVPALTASATLQSVEEQRQFLRDRKIVAADDPLPLARPTALTSRPAAILLVCRDGSGVFVKQPSGYRGRARLAREAGFLEALGSGAAAESPLRDHVPRVITWEPERGLLVLTGYVERSTSMTLR